MRQLPPLNRVLTRLQILLSDTNSSLDDVAELIRLDAAMTTRIIHVSNSAWFGRGGPCHTIAEAVNRIGFREVYYVVAVTAAKAVVAQPLAAYGRNANALWRESIACAFGADLIAQRIGEDPAVAYMAGLLHGVGRVAINHYLTTSGARTSPLVDDGFPVDFSAAEVAVLGFDQAAVGACMLEKWAFDAAIVEPVRHQYDPLAAGDLHDRMAAALCGARLLRTAACAPAAVCKPEEVEDVFGVLRLEAGEVLALLPDVQRQVSRSLEMLGA
jgi:HD-like signal output (HDOD) protein